MSILRNDMSGLPDGFVTLAPVDEIRSEAEWAAKAFVNSEIESVGKGIDSSARESIEAKTAEFLENRALENGLDIYALNDRIFQARTGRALISDVKNEAGVKGLGEDVTQSIQVQERIKVEDLENAQRFFDEEEVRDFRANAAAKMMLDRDHLGPDDQSTSVDTLKNNLVSAAKYADLDVHELAMKLEIGKALKENAERKSQELKAFGVMRDKPELDHLHDLRTYQEASEQRSVDAKYVARSVMKKESSELSGVSQSEAEAVLTEKLIRSDIKGEVDLAGMTAEIRVQQENLSDEIEF